MLTTSAEAGTIVVGAGIGGLAAALRLAGAGHPVRVFERAAGPGGKMRTLPSAAGPVDAGPTVLTLRAQFDALFDSVGARLDDHVTLHAEPLIARHHWRDGASLDLFADRGRSADAVGALSGPKGRREFLSFCARAERLFDAFAGPVIRAPRPDMGGIVAASLANPGLMGQLLPGRTLWGALGAQFSDPRLRQLFARYATYVGGSPMASPALLALIWRAEEAGVWRVEGGMSALAHGIEGLARSFGAEFAYGNGVAAIQRAGDGFEVVLEDASRHRARSVVFNGDPAALTRRLLGPGMVGAVPDSGVRPRSLSAHVWAFAARAEGVALTHHNLFFNDDYLREFSDIAAGRIPADATLYVCAQDRGTGTSPPELERFEIIRNAAPVMAGVVTDPDREAETCRTRTFETLSRMGLSFTPTPGRSALTTPAGFGALFPGSDGSLYGRSPHGMMASFRRPVAESRIPGLYLAGGGVHPGAGVPMALTSGRHAAEAILTARTSTSASRPMAMRGGMSMGSRTMAGTVSRSSGS